MYQGPAGGVFGMVILYFPRTTVLGALSTFPVEVLTIIEIRTDVYSDIPKDDF